MPTLVARSRLDEERFKVRTARAEVQSEGDVAEVLAFCAREQIQFAIVRCPVERIEAVHALEMAGFALMDTWVLFEAELDAKTIQTAPTPVIRRLQPHEIEAVVELARSGFSGYLGHYHADRRIDPALADEVYVSWARRCAAGEAADAILVVDEGDGIVAFSAFTMDADRTGELVLGAVLPAARGRGWYQELTRAGMRWAREAGATRFRAATHLSNLAAQRSWSRLGMAPVRAAYTLHRWFD